MNLQKNNRRLAGSYILLLFILGPLGGWVYAADPVVDVTPQLEQRIGRGLAYLAVHQRDDGSWKDGERVPEVAVTSVSLMSFLAAGHVPDAGKYGLTVRNAVEYLIKSCPADGYFGKIDGSRMYGQAMVTMALVEAYGVEPDPARRQQLKNVIDKALKVILDAQDVPKSKTYSGGWRYEPTSTSSDLSVTGWNVLAMRAAQNAGFDVPAERVKRAVDFILRCYVPDQGFSYAATNVITPSMTGVGLLSLYLLDAANRPELKVAARYFIDHPLNDKTPYPYYCIYYATQGAYQAGEPTWSVVWKNALNQLEPLQRSDGGWPPSWTTTEPGRMYATAMALLSLEVPYRLLPIYQR